MAWWGGGGAWPEYVPVATKIARAKKAAEKLRKQGVDIQPVNIDGRKIASSFWGKAWCDHMDSHHDFENRLPRGRSYVRNGSVVHLEVSKGKIQALVAGSETYRVDIAVELLSAERWTRIKNQCAGQISSILDLLKGRLSDGVMRIVTDRDNGLFPGPKEFKMKCSCPDIAAMCKHIAAVFYGIGNRLDHQPELLFLLRGVDHAELAVGGGVDAIIAKGDDGAPQLAGTDLSEMFGIELLDSAKPAGIRAKKNAAAKPKASTPKTRRKTAKTLAGKEPITLSWMVSEDATPVAAADSAPKAKAKAKAKAKTKAKVKSRVTDSPSSTPKEPKTRKPAAAKKEAKRLDIAMRLVKEYVATKKETPTKSGSKKSRK